MSEGGRKLPGDMAQAERLVAPPAPHRQPIAAPGIVPFAGAARTVAYFGPDRDDAAVHRRVAQWRHAGFKVVALAFSRRTRGRVADNDFIDLGRVPLRSRVRRLLPLMAAAFRLIWLRESLAHVDLFIGRNLDNALLALFARWLTASSSPVVYEILDVNASCTTAGWQSALLRRVEKWTLARVTLLVVSSPHFISAYYERMLHFQNNWLLFENKIPKYVGLAHAAAPEAGRGSSRAAGAAEREPRPRWRIGWFGYLDDEWSWSILRRLAQELHDQVFIYVRGAPYTNFDMDRFLADIAALDNAAYGGPYKNPEQLAEIYGAVDMVWSADLTAPSANSKWLLTNGIYEAGFFGKPVIGLARTAVGDFLHRNGSGWCLDEPIGDQLVAFVRNLTLDRYNEKRRAIAELRSDSFVETDEIEVIWRTLRNQPARQGTTATSPRTLEPLL